MNATPRTGERSVTGLYTYAPVCSAVDQPPRGYTPLQVTWRATEPSLLSVHITQTDGRIVAWDVARELARTSDGSSDIRVLRTEGTTWLCLSPSAGTVLLGLSTTWVDRLLKATDFIIPGNIELPVVQEES